jgi:hypothetical protein
VQRVTSVGWFLGLSGSVLVQSSVGAAGPLCVGAIKCCWSSLSALSDLLAWSCQGWSCELCMMPVSGVTTEVEAVSLQLEIERSVLEQWAPSVLLLAFFLKHVGVLKAHWLWSARYHHHNYYSPHLYNDKVRQRRHTTLRQQLFMICFCCSYVNIKPLIIIMYHAFIGIILNWLR